MNEKKHANTLNDNPKKEKTNNSNTLSVGNLSTLETFWIVRQNKQLHATHVTRKHGNYDSHTHFYNIDNIVQVR